MIDDRYIVAVTYSRDVFGNGGLFNLSNARDNALEPYLLLKQKCNDLNITCGTVDQFDYKSIDFLIIRNLSKDVKIILKLIKANPYVKLLYVLTEPPGVLPFNNQFILNEFQIDQIFTCLDDLLDFNITNTTKLNMCQPFTRIENIPYVEFNQKYFLSIISFYKKKRIKKANSLYSERLNAIDFFLKQNEGIDVYGFGWENCSIDNLAKSFFGPIESKIEILKNYKFSICYEGYSCRGYISEKIFDCFSAGCVPVYLGAPNILEYIPKDCFIDARQFNSYHGLYHYLSNIQETEYSNYIQATENFLKTDDYFSFTSHHFSNILVQCIISFKNQMVPHKSRTKVKSNAISVLMKRPYFVLKTFFRYRKFYKDLFLE